VNDTVPEILIRLEEVFVTRIVKHENKSSVHYDRCNIRHICSLTYMERSHKYIANE